MDYATPDSIVDMAKNMLDIRTPTPAMTDTQIKEVCLEIGMRAPDTIWDSDGPIVQRMGIEAMLFIALTEFPEFYERHGLAQFN